MSHLSPWGYCYLHNGAEIFGEVKDRHLHVDSESVTSAGLPPPALRAADRRAAAGRASDM